MKEKTISLRVSEDTLKILEKNAQKAKLSKSDYLRCLITGTAIHEDNGRQELAKEFCNLYRIIGEQHLENNAMLMEGVASLCQKLC